MHCAFLTDLHRLRPSQNFMICDAGGGTVVRLFRAASGIREMLTARRDQDLAVYKLIGLLSNMEIAEMCARSGANCGSLFLDLRFRELVRTLLADHPAHLDGTRRMLPSTPMCAHRCTLCSGVARVFHAQLLGDDQAGLPRRGR